MSTLFDFSELTLDLYQAVGSVAPEKFRHWAFERLQQCINFDSAVWIQATLVEDIPVTQSIYLHNQPDTMIEEYAKWNTNDAILEAILCNPGQCFLWRDLEDQEKRYETEMYKEYEAKYGLEDGISIMIPFRGSGIQSFLSLYRSERENPFTVNDRELFQAIAPHLIEAENTVIARHVRNTHNIPQYDQSVAMISIEGYLYMTETGFLDCLKTGWPDWEPPKIPVEISDFIESNPNDREIINGFFIQANRTSDGSVISIRPTNPMDLLSSREQQVATLVADGIPYKTVAKELNISPSTVTNHVNSIHSKLGVSTRAELNKLLGDI